MKIKFWGTRGSLPRAITESTLIHAIDTCVQVAQQSGIQDLSEFLKFIKSGAYRRPLTFGGNTTCTEVAVDEQRIIIDAGSGLAFAGDAFLTGRTREFHLFMTHFHWDHIMGLPFFVPIFMPGMTVHIYHVHKTGPDDLRVQFNGRNFPVLWEQLGAQINFHLVKLYEPTQIGPLKVTPFALDHPGGCFGYRVDSKDGQSMAIGVDGEFKRNSARDLGKDLPYYQNLDALVFDAQYEMDELANKYDWGHSTPSIGIDIAMREGIKCLVLSHHDPRSNDEKSHKMLADANIYAQNTLKPHQSVWTKRGQPNGPEIVSAFDGMEILCKKEGRVIC